MRRGLLLAAGSSRRMGCDKLGLPWRGTTVLEATVARWLAVPELDELVMVRRELRAEEAWPGLRVVENPGADEGMGSSLRVGARALPDDTEALVLGLADMPELQSQTISALLAAFAPLGPRGLVAPTFQGRRGHPVVFGAAHLPALRALGGDRGASDLLRECVEDLLLVPVEDPGVQKDLDCPADLEVRP